jgi:hypothetical protein
VNRDPTYRNGAKAGLPGSYDPISQGLNSKTVEFSNIRSCPAALSTDTMMGMGIEASMKAVSLAMEENV